MIEQLWYQLLEEGFKIGFMAARAYVAGSADRNPNMPCKMVLKELQAAGTGVDEFVESKLKEIVKNTNDDLKLGMH